MTFSLQKEKNDRWNYLKLLEHEFIKPYDHPTPEFIEETSTFVTYILDKHNN